MKQFKIVKCVVYATYTSSTVTQSATERDKFQEILFLLCIPRSRWEEIPRVKQTMLLTL